MARPNGRLDLALQRNEASLVRARDRQKQEAQADADLQVALRDLDRAQSNVERAERRVCKMHGDDEALCRRLRCENLLLQTRPAKALVTR